MCKLDGGLNHCRRLVYWNLCVLYKLSLCNENGPTFCKLCPTPVAEFVFGVMGITTGCSRATTTIYNSLVIFRQNFLWFEVVSTLSQTEEKGQVFSLLMTLLITLIILYDFLPFINSGMLDWEMKRASHPVTYFLLCRRWPFTLILALPGAYCFLRNRLIHHLTCDFCRVICETTPQNASSDLFWCDVTEVVKTATFLLLVQSF